jgi:hypothetical protein
MHRFILALCAGTVLILMAIGCSGQGGTPIAPQNNTPDLSNAQTVDTTEAVTGHSLLGFWDGTIDPENKTIEFEPVRTVLNHFNMVPILEGGTMKIKLDGPVTVTAGVMNCNIKLIHPFSGKLNLSGFDVKGVFITKGSEVGFSDTDLRFAGPAETRLINSDGFTRWWNPKEFLHTGITGYNQGNLGGVIDPSTCATVNGYKLYADGLAADQMLSSLDKSNRSLFTAGATNSRIYAINLASGLKFNYAVDCSWAKPTPNPPVNVPEDFPPAANQAEPWWIEVTETNNTLWFANSSHGGNVNYEVLIHDWQDASDLGAVTMECPGVFSGEDVDLETIDANTVKATFAFPLPTLASSNPLDVLISVETPGDYSPALTGVSKQLMAYYRHVTTVSPSKPTFNLAPFAIMHATTPVSIYKDQTVSFDATGSYDNDGIIVDYLWDFNGNGIYGEETYAGDKKTPTYTFTAAGNIQVRLKVRDDGGKSSISDPVIVTVILDTNTPPFAVAQACAESASTTGAIREIRAMCDGRFMMLSRRRRAIWRDSNRKAGWRHPTKFSNISTRYIRIRLMSWLKFPMRSS